MRWRVFTVAAFAVPLFALAPAGCGGGTTSPPPPPPGSWAPRAPMPEARTEVSAAALEGILYVAGGFAPAPGGGTTAPAEIFAYDPAADAWETAGTLIQRVNHAGMAAVGDRVYVVGGFRDNTFVATAEFQILDPATGTVVAGPPLPTPRGALAVAVLDDRIHAIGGVGAAGNVGAHEVFDPAAGTWSSRAPMPTPRDHHGAAAVGGRIFVAAGRVGGTNLAVLEVYDPATDSWSVGPPVPTARSGIAVVALGGKVYVFGGEELTPGGSTFATAERFDPEDASWEEVAPMPTARHGLAAGVVAGAIYVIAGGPTPGFSFSSVNERFTPE